MRRLRPLPLVIAAAVMLWAGYLIWQGLTGPPKPEILPFEGSSIGCKAIGDVLLCYDSYDISPYVELIGFGGKLIERIESPARVFTCPGYAPTDAPHLYLVETDQHTHDSVLCRYGMDGSKVWEVVLDTYAIKASWLEASGLIITEGEDLAAFDEKGQAVWGPLLPPETKSQWYAVFPDALCAMTDTHELLLLNDQGRLEWKQQLPNGQVWFVTAAPDMALITQDNCLRVFSRAGENRWNLQLGKDRGPMEARGWNTRFANGRLVLFHKKGRLLHVDSTGRLLWRTHLGPSEGGNSVELPNGNTFVLCSYRPRSLLNRIREEAGRDREWKRTVWLVDGEGQRLWRATVPAAEMVNGPFIDPQGRPCMLIERRDKRRFIYRWPAK